MTKFETRKILELLEMRNAMSAMRGKACPIACKVVRSLQAAV